MLHLPLHQFRKNLTATLNNDPVATLSFLAEEFLGRTVFSTVFNLEDQVLTHLILTYEIPVRIFTRTGSEHLDILARTVEYYGQPIELINRQSELLAAELTDRHPEQSCGGSASIMRSTSGRCWLCTLCCGDQDLHDHRRLADRGGVAAAPLSARLAGRLPVRTMFVLVGVVVIFWSLRILWNAM